MATGSDQMLHFNKVIQKLDDLLEFCPTTLEEVRKIQVGMCLTMLGH